MMQRYLILSVLALTVLCRVPAGRCGEIVSTVRDQRDIALTVYNHDLALVRDTRQVTLPTGVQTLALREVSARIRPQTALLNAPGMTILEQNFEYDLLGPQSLLAKYTGKQVMLVRTHPTTGEERLVPATVLSTAKGVVLRVGEHIETGVPGRLVYPDVPDDLRDRPTLTMLVNNRTTEPQTIELSYLTAGLSWHADYVARLEPQENFLDLSGWVTLTNESGTTYTNARLKLVAGDVNRVPDQQALRKAGRKVMYAAVESDTAMREESLFEYHLYSLDRRTTIREKQSKQVSLMQASRVPVRKEFVLQGQPFYYLSRSGDLGRHLKVQIMLIVKNEHQSGLGLPLPAGVLRVYKPDSEGGLQFIGEDRIDHTPEKATLRLELGRAFDITAEKKQLWFKKVSGMSPYNYVYDSAYEIILNNGGKSPVQVRVIEPVPGDWKMLESSAPHQRESATAVSWDIDVPAKGTARLTYTVRVRQ